ncbi:hypothetical protein FISHEDRAFT_74980 [Fistulina hepatica ATCC 64428]|uniref:HMG box domain-containing protein n=1 Tax=Fistulina hepatica ATCC 64428 TaxID=1128425 RepID=A0A0D7A9P4_9AGAR|nr:hypothetical protein FISHEDRAFT_74980 [Fistulina hepatica ATCC 64428]
MYYRGHNNDYHHAYPEREYGYTGRGHYHEHQCDRHCAHDYAERQHEYTGRGCNYRGWDVRRFDERDALGLNDRDLHQQNDCNARPPTPTMPRSPTPPTSRPSISTPRRRLPTLPLPSFTQSPASARWMQTLRCNQSQSPSYWTESQWPVYSTQHQRPSYHIEREPPSYSTEYETTRPYADPPPPLPSHVTPAGAFLPSSGGQSALNEAFRSAGSTNNVNHIPLYRNLCDDGAVSPDPDPDLEPISFHSEVCWEEDEGMESATPRTVSPADLQRPLSRTARRSPAPYGRLRSSPLRTGSSPFRAGSPYRVNSSHTSEAGPSRTSAQIFSRPGSPVSGAPASLSPLDAVTASLSALDAPSTTSRPSSPASGKARQSSTSRTRGGSGKTSCPRRPVVVEVLDEARKWEIFPRKEGLCSPSTSTSDTSACTSTSTGSRSQSASGAAARAGSSSRAGGARSQSSGPGVGVFEFSVTPSQPLAYTASSAQQPYVQAFGASSQNIMPNPPLQEFTLNPPPHRPRKGDEDYVKRPENAFILFRRKCCEEREEEERREREEAAAAGDVDGDESKDEDSAKDEKDETEDEKEGKDAKGKGKRRPRQADLSKTISLRWKALSAEERKVWEDLARAKKREHEERYPGYVYRPVRTRGPKDAKGKKKAMGHIVSGPAPGFQSAFQVQPQGTLFTSTSAISTGVPIAAQGGSTFSFVVEHPGPEPSSPPTPRPQEQIVPPQFRSPVFQTPAPDFRDDPVATAQSPARDSSVEAFPSSPVAGGPQMPSPDVQPQSPGDSASLPQASHSPSSPQVSSASQASAAAAVPQSTPTKSYTFVVPMHSVRPHPYSRRSTSVPGAPYQEFRIPHVDTAPSGSCPTSPNAVQFPTDARDVFPPVSTQDAFHSPPGSFSGLSGTTYPSSPLSLVVPSSECSRASLSTQSSPLSRVQPPELNFTASAHASFSVSSPNASFVPSPNTAFPVSPHSPGSFPSTADFTYAYNSASFDQSLSNASSLEQQSTPTFDGPASFGKDDVSLLPLLPQDAGFDFVPSRGYTQPFWETAPAFDDGSNGWVVQRQQQQNNPRSNFDESRQLFGAQGSFAQQQGFSQVPSFDQQQQQEPQLSDEQYLQMINMTTGGVPTTTAMSGMSKTTPRSASGRRARRDMSSSPPSGPTTPTWPHDHTWDPITKTQLAAGWPNTAHDGNGLSDAGISISLGDDGNGMDWSLSTPDQQGGPGWAQDGWSQQAWSWPSHEQGGRQGEWQQTTPKQSVWPALKQQQWPIVQDVTCPAVADNTTYWPTTMTEMPADWPKASDTPAGWPTQSTTYNPFVWDDDGSSGLLRTEDFDINSIRPAYMTIPTLAPPSQPDAPAPPVDVQMGDGTIRSPPTVAAH